MIRRSFILSVISAAVAELSPRLASGRPGHPGILPLPGEHLGIPPLPGEAWRRFHLDGGFRLNMRAGGRIANVDIMRWDISFDVPGFDRAEFSCDFDPAARVMRWEAAYAERVP